MNFKMRWQLARKNLIANKIFNVPFVISSSLLLGIFYILLSLLSNDYVQHRHPALPQLLSLAAIVIAILSVIFIFYGNNFTMKNRNQELGLYGILGLEKKHIAGIFFLESFILYIITFLCALINGFILGKLSFLTLNYLVKDYTSSLQNYSFDSKAALITLLLTTGIFILLFIITIFKIGLSSPMQLFNKQKSGEKPPKSNKLIGILGIILIGIGYFLAIHQKALPLTQSNISLLIRNFFIAVLFVISGTYLTFISGSILILKSFQKR